MNQKGFVNILLIMLVVILTGTVGYLTLVNKSQQPTPTTAPKPNTQSKDSRFVSNEYGSIAGCVNVQFNEKVTREQARLLLAQFNIASPSFLSENIKPYGAFVPTLEVIVRDFSQTATLLRKDSSIADVQLHSGPGPEGNYFVYVLFIDSMTLDRAYQLLNDTHNLRVSGNRNYPGIKATILTLEVTAGSENSIVKSLRSSSIVQDALQCPVSPPVRPL